MREKIIVVIMLQKTIILPLKAHIAMGKNSVALHAHYYIPTELGQLEKKSLFYVIWITGSITGATERSGSHFLER